MVWVEVTLKLGVLKYIQYLCSIPWLPLNTTDLSKSWTWEKDATVAKMHWWVLAMSLAPINSKKPHWPPWIHLISILWTFGWKNDQFDHVQIWNWPVLRLFSWIKFKLTLRSTRSTSTLPLIPGWWNHRPREHVWNRQKGRVNISDLATRQMGAATADAAPKR